MAYDIHRPPIDPASAERLQQRGLRFAVLDTSDREAYVAWYHAVNRGFNAAQIADTDLQERLDNFGDRRSVGVWDDGGADPITPVATSSGWVAGLTLPGRTSIPAWAISTVTVAPTHRRRGIATGLLEAELRTAATLGIPVAILTVSEATIYSRFGFAPSAMQAQWNFEFARARWIGPKPAGRLHLVPGDELRKTGQALVERVRLETPGQIEFGGVHWMRLFGIYGEARGRDHRSVRYDDESGEMQGFAIYQVTRTPHSEDTVLEVVYLVSATDDAYAALWRYLLEVDLVTAVKAHLRAVDEPVQWQIADARAARKTDESDHLWTRILDVPTALEARRYSAAARLVVKVDDAQGFTTGTYLLEIDAAGAAQVSSTEDLPDLALSVVELSAIYLGGVSARLLARAGRIEELTEGAVLVADRAFASTVTPWLSIWF
jgi:predicted acetyltransferase